MPKNFTSPTQKIGETGENIAVKFLMKQGFSIIERNYTKKWGEIDVVGQKGNKLHFFEVKSVTCDILMLKDSYKLLSDKQGAYRPEDNMHPWKLKRLSRAIESFMASGRVSDETDWQIDLVLVYINMKLKKARVEIVENIIL